MNMNRLNYRWPVGCGQALELIDRMSVQTAFECGLITQEERDVITDTFVAELQVCFETKGYATADDVHQVPSSEIVRRFRAGRGQTEPNMG